MAGGCLDHLHRQTGMIVPEDVGRVTSTDSEGSNWRSYHLSECDTDSTNGKANDSSAAVSDLVHNSGRPGPGPFRHKGHSCDDPQESRGHARRMIVYAERSSRR